MNNNKPSEEMIALKEEINFRLSASVPPGSDAQVSEKFQIEAEG